MAKSRRVSHTDKVQSQPIAKIADNVNDNDTVKDKDILFKERKEKFILWFNQQKEIKTGKKGMVRVLSKTDDNNLKKLFKDYKLSDFQIALDNMFKNTWVQENKMYTIAHLLAINNFNRYLGEGEKEPKKVIKNLYD